MLYQRKKKSTSLNTIEFLDTLAYNPHWQGSGILIFLCKYYTVISDTLVGSFLDMLFLLLALILSELHELQDKAHRRICVRDITFCTVSFLCLFVAFFVYSLLLPKWHTSGMAAIKIHILLWVVIFCVMISWVNGQKY